MASQDEVPPDSLPQDAREYLNRVFGLIDVELKNSDILPRRTDMLPRPHIGKLYFFNNAIPNPVDTETVVDSEGYYGFTSTGWVKLHV